MGSGGGGGRRRQHSPGGPPACYVARSTLTCNGSLPQPPASELLRAALACGQILPQSAAQRRAEGFSRPPSRTPGAFVCRLEQRVGGGSAWELRSRRAAVQRRRRLAGSRLGSEWGVPVSGAAWACSWL